MCVNMHNLYFAAAQLTDACYLMLQDFEMRHREHSLDKTLVILLPGRALLHLHLCRSWSLQE